MLWTFGAYSPLRVHENVEETYLVTHIVYPSELLWEIIPFFLSLTAILSAVYQGRVGPRRSEASVVMPHSGLSTPRLTRPGRSSAPWSRWKKQWSSPTYSCLCRYGRGMPPQRRGHCSDGGGSIWRSWGGSLRRDVGGRTETAVEGRQDLAESSPRPCRGSPIAGKLGAPQQWVVPKATLEPPGPYSYIYIYSVVSFCSEVTLWGTHRQNRAF